MTDFKFFPRIFEDIVNSVVSDYDSSNGLVPAFEFGTYLELTKQVAIKNRNIAAGEKQVKYPLIWLVWEAQESLQKWTSKVSYNVSPRIFICNATDPNYSSSQRYDANFVSVLYPLFELLQDHIEFNTFISSSTMYDFQLADHLYWGSTLELNKRDNVIQDALDAIEIKFNNLEINKIC